MRDTHTHTHRARGAVGEEPLPGRGDTFVSVCVCVAGLDCSGTRENVGVSKGERKETRVSEGPMIRQIRQASFKADTSDELEWGRHDRKKNEEQKNTTDKLKRGRRQCSSMF